MALHPPTVKTTKEITMSNQTEWQKWCEETAPVMAAAGRGEIVQVSCHDGTWEDKQQAGAFSHHAKYRIKPRTIRIGEYDVPEPMREAPEVGSRVFLFNMVGDTKATRWDGDDVDKRMLNSGICHSTQEAAELHAKALISLTAKKD